MLSTEVRRSSNAAPSSASRQSVSHCPVQFGRVSRCLTAFRVGGSGFGQSHLAALLFSFSFSLLASFVGNFELDCPRPFSSRYLESAAASASGSYLIPNQHSATNSISLYPSTIHPYPLSSLYYSYIMQLFVRDLAGASHAISE